MLEEKKDKFICICFVVFVVAFILLAAIFAVGCSTTGRIIVSGKSIGTEQADTALSELTDQQAESTVISQQITDTGSELADSIKESISELGTGKDEEAEFRNIIQQIKNRQPVSCGQTDSADSTAAK